MKEDYFDVFLMDLDSYIFSNFDEITEHFRKKGNLNDTSVVTHIQFHHDFGMYDEPDDARLIVFWKDFG